MSFELNACAINFESPLIMYDLIGKVTLPGMGIEHHEGSPITIDEDYFGNPRDLTEKITAGPFADMKEGGNRIIVWPRK